MVRSFAEDDVPAVVALFGRVYPDLRWALPSACEDYFREILFQNPWRELALPSWVAEEHGRITGFLGVVPRPMLLGERPVRVAVGCQFLVDPDRRNGLTALQLAQKCLSGPQDLTLADGANELSRRLWIGLGGAAPLQYSLHWTRPLRPARYLLSLLAGRAAVPWPLALAAQPLASLADAVAARLPPNDFQREEHGLEDRPLDSATMLAELPSMLNGTTLQPGYDAGSLTWLLIQAARKTRHGKLRARLVLEAGRPIGWYLYYLLEGGVSEVVQLAARDGAFDRVLRRLLADAWRRGALAVRGRVDPRFAQELSDRHCWFRREGTWTLVHSRHAEVNTAIHNGEAFLSRLEGEWWLRFLGG